MMSGACQVRWQFNNTFTVAGHLESPLLHQYGGVTETLRDTFMFRSDLREKLAEERRPAWH